MPGSRHCQNRRSIWATHFALAIGMTVGRPDSAKPNMPHDNLYVRLGPSAIHGIGVFAIRSISEGTNIFANDRSELVWVAASDLETAALCPADRQFYHDFCIPVGNWLICPSHFDNLTPGWYCNEAPQGQDANVRVDADLNFLAARDIAAGEEVTVVYADLQTCGLARKILTRWPSLQRCPDLST